MNTYASNFANEKFFRSSVQKFFEKKPEDRLKVIQQLKLEDFIFLITLDDKSECKIENFERVNLNLEIIKMLEKHKYHPLRIFSNRNDQIN